MQCSWYGTGIQPQWSNADDLIALGTTSIIFIKKKLMHKANEFLIYALKVTLQ